jgi:bleomycin hydrolase
VKEGNIWNEKEVISNIKSIMNHYMGTPPKTFEYNGKDIAPMDFAKNILKIVPNDYYCFMSTSAQRYNERGELEVADNWWHSSGYININLDDFISVFKNALEKGYTVAFCGDVSEPGYNRYAEVGIIPSFDIPSEYIDENAREMRFRNGSTSDDHCMHVVGYLEKDDGWWFLIKDSSSGGFDGEHKGYIFLSEDYIKLKILAVMVHKDGAREVLDTIIK